MTDLDELLRSSLKGRPPSGPLATWEEIERLATRRQRRRRRIGVVAGTLVTAGALLVGSATFGDTGPSGSSTLARASVATTTWPPDRVLHVRIRMVSHFGQPDSLQDVWQLTSPPYTARIRQAFPADGGPATTSESATDSVGLGQAYDWRSNQVVETTDTPMEWRPEGVDQMVKTEMQAWVNNSHATSLGKSEIDGQQVIGFEAFGNERLYLDAQTFLPAVVQSFGKGVGAQKAGYDLRYTWSLLPDSPESLSLLDVAQQHPEAAVTHLSQAAWVKTQVELGQLQETPTTPGA